MYPRSRPLLRDIAQVYGLARDSIRRVSKASGFIEPAGDCRDQEPELRHGQVVVEFGEFAIQGQGHDAMDRGEKSPCPAGALLGIDDVRFQDVLDEFEKSVLVGAVLRRRLASLG